MALACLAFASGLALVSGFDVNLLVRDPAASYGFPPYAGFVSHVGVLIMTATAGVLAFAATLTPNDRLIFGGVALLSAVVASDDLLMFHDRVAPDLLAIPEIAVLAAYGLLGALVTLLAFRRDGNRLPPLLVAAGALLGASMGIDATIEIRHSIFFEDSLKILGYSTWAAYWMAEAGQSVRRTGGIE